MEWEELLGKTISKVRMKGSTKIITFYDGSELLITGIDIGYYNSDGKLIYDVVLED